VGSDFWREGGEIPDVCDISSTKNNNLIVLYRRPRPSMCLCCARGVSSIFRVEFSGLNFQGGAFPWSSLPDQYIKQSINMIYKNERDCRPHEGETRAGRGGVTAAMAGAAKLRAHRAGT